MRRSLCLSFIISTLLLCFSFKTLARAEGALEVVEKIPPPEAELEVVDKIPAPSPDFTAVPIQEAPAPTLQVVETIPVETAPIISNPIPLPQYPVLTNPVPIEPTPVLTSPVPVELPVSSEVSISNLSFIRKLKAALTKIFSLIF